MASGVGQLDPQRFIGPARTIALEVMQKNRIFFGPGALGAVDTIVIEYMPRVVRRFQEDRLDFAGYQRLVRTAAERAVKEFRTRGIRSIDDPDEVLRIVHPMLNVYPFDC
jgi:hypothetical protein